MVEMARLAVLLLGTAGGAFGSFIGFLVFLFLVLSFPVDSGSGTLLPAVGGLLFIMLGLSGALGAALASGSYRAGMGLLISSGILGILGLAFFCFYGEGRACLLLLILLGISGAAVYFRSQKGGALLMLLGGVLGLFVGQASMVFLLCGWKTWIFSSTLLVSGGILALTAPRGIGSHLPLLNSDRRPLRRAGYAIYASLGLLLVMLATFMLLSVPDKEASAKADLIEADFAEVMGRLDIAVEAYDRLIALDPSNIEGWYRKGYALSRMGKAHPDAYSRSIQCYDRVIELNQSYAEASPHESPWILKGDALRAMERSDEALGCYEKALSLDMSDEEAWYKKGLALDDLGRHAEAIHAYERAVGLNPSNVDALERARPLGGVERGDEARRMLEAAPERRGCGCEPTLAEDRGCRDDRSCKEVLFKASITSPGDVGTFPRGSLVTFNCSISGGRKPFTYLWRSSINGEIGDEASFSTDDLSKGLHAVTLTVIDSASATSVDAIEIGVADPSICGNVNPRPKYYPIDTPCRDIWPNASADCMEFEVCHPGLDYIVEEAVDCCDGTPIGGTACSYANANSGGDKKRCRALYIIKAFGPEARYMSGYALFKACCSGYPECTRTCWTPLGGTPEVRQGFNENVKALPCDPAEWGVRSWRSDANMSENSCSMGLYPTHATVNILNTGVCMDYSAAVTTSIRKAGYSKGEVFSTGSTGYDLPFLGHHPGHAYGMVLLPGDSKYHFVDATGNGEGISIGNVPGYFWFTGCFMGLVVPIRVFDWWVGYCNKTSDEAYSDAGSLASPPRSMMMGC